MIKLSTLAIFSISSICSFVTLKPGLAAAFSIRQHGSACASSNPNVPSTDGMEMTGPGGGSIFCPAPDSDSLLPQNMTTINIHGCDGNTNGLAMGELCIIDWFDQFGQCGNLRDNSPPSTVGNYAIGLGNPLWTGQHTNDFKSVFVNLPGPGTFGTSTLRGVFYN